VTVKANGWVVVGSLGTAFTMLRKPLPGLTMQSFGSLLPPLPPTGYEQTLTSCAPCGRKDFEMTAMTVVSFGWFCVPSVAGKGSVAVTRSAGGLPERRVAVRGDPAGLEVGRGVRQRRARLGAAIGLGVRARRRRTASRRSP
jgi:hypothetical protein